MDIRNPALPPPSRDAGDARAANPFIDLWAEAVIRSDHLEDLLAEAERFIAGFEGDPDQDGVDALLAEIREALAPDVTAEPPRQPGWLSTAALFALIPLCLAATAGVIWSHLL